MESYEMFKLSFGDFEEKINLMKKQELESVLCFAYGFISSVLKRRKNKKVRENETRTIKG